MCSAEQAKPLFFGASHLASDLFKPGFFGVVATKKNRTGCTRQMGIDTDQLLDVFGIFLAMGTRPGKR